MKQQKLYLMFLIVIFCLNHKLEAQWIQTNGPSNQYVYILGSSSGNIFAGTGGGIFRTTDDGSNWMSLTNGVSDNNWVYSMATSDSNIFAGTDFSGLYLSTNYGNTWAELNGGLINHVNALKIDSMNIYAGTGGGIYRSTNLGQTWSSHLLDSIWVYSILAEDNRLWVGSGHGVFFSKNSGMSWVQINNGDPNSTVFSFVKYGTNIFAGTANGIYVIPIDSTSWTKISNLTFVFSILAINNNLYAGTGHGIFLSSDNGLNWTEVDTGMTNKDVNTLILVGDYLYAGTWGSGVWKRPLDEITSVEAVQSKLNTYKLFQNYPNPFNPSTTISFSIPKSGLVKLIIYDVLGKKIKTLLNEIKTPGSYKTEFNAEELSSGIYFYKIQAGDFTETKKLILMK
jgi:photosystem II stability/assembly factor-like uncharacterized protein